MAIFNCYVSSPEGIISGIVIPTYPPQEVPAPPDRIPQLPCTSQTKNRPSPRYPWRAKDDFGGFFLSQNVAYFLAYPQNCGKLLGDYKLWEFWVPIFRQPHIHATRISQRPSGCLCWLWVGLEYSTSILNARYKGTQ